MTDPSALELMKQERIERLKRVGECHPIDHVLIYNDGWLCMFCKKTETEIDGQAGDYRASA